MPASMVLGIDDDVVVDDGALVDVVVEVEVVVDAGAFVVVVDVGGWLVVVEPGCSVVVVDVVGVPGAAGGDAPGAAEPVVVATTAWSASRADAAGLGPSSTGAATPFGTARSPGLQGDAGRCPGQAAA